jgi:DNA-binding beta-propeller fold protein YncE
VCERGSNRIQVFTKQGKFVSSFFVHPQSPARGKECGGNFGGCGNPYNLTFSHDARQTYVLVADGNNNKIWIHNRSTGAVVGSIGSYGMGAGQFHVIDAIAMDSLGNIYTGEVGTAKRVQKFILTNGDGVKRARAHE